MVEVCLGFIVDTYVLCEVASKTKHFHYTGQ